MNKNKKLLFGCAMALSAFDAYSMFEQNQKNSKQEPKESMMDTKSPGKFDSLRILFNQLNLYMPTIKNNLVHKLYNNRPFTLNSSEHNLSLTVPVRKLCISGYFNTLLNNSQQNIIDNKQLKKYEFDSEISKETVLLISDYFKQYGTEKQETLEQDILKSNYIIEIYRLADKLHIKPLITFLNHNIIDTLIESGFIKNLVKEVGEEQLEQTLNSYLSGNLDTVLEIFKNNPKYFDWNNPIDYTSSIMLSPDEKYLYSSRNIYDLNTNQIVAKIPDLRRSQSGLHNFISFSSNAHYFAITAMGESDHLLYDLKNNQTITFTNKKIKGFSANEIYVAIKPYGVDAHQLHNLQTNEIIGTITSG